MYEVESYEYRGHTIRLVQEDDTSIFDPRDWDTVGTMNCAHRNYNLGDMQTDPDDMVVECPVKCEGYYLPVPTTAPRVTGIHTSYYDDAGWTVCPVCDGAGELADPVRWAVEVEGATVVLPLYLYDHGSITMSTSTRLYPPTDDKGGNPFSCPWDSGCVGIIYSTPKGLQRHFQRYTSEHGYSGEWLTEDGNPPSVERIEEMLRREVQVYDDYLTGNILSYMIDGPVCDDACGGFFPDLDVPHAREWDYVKREAENVVDHSIAWEQEQARKIDAMMAL